MTADLSVSAPPSVLLFGPLDPTSAQHLVADALSCQLTGCHPATVVTGVHIQDTTTLDHINLLPPEQIHDQMRCLLEDLNISAIKAGPLYSVEEASILGQILADYPQLPLVLHLQSIPDSVQVGREQDSDEIIQAIFDLVLPFCHLVVADQLMLQQWQAEEHLPTNQHPARTLISLGARAVLYTTTHSTDNSHYYQLYTEQGLYRQWPLPELPLRVQDTEGMLACICATQFAWQLELAAACEQAINYVDRASKHVFQAGMGNRLIHQAGILKPLTYSKQP